MANSSTVSSGDEALATQYNNLRKDVLDVTTGHDHTGAADEGKTIDHGDTTGKADDDHTQYWNDARGAAGAKLVKLDDFATPDDNTDLNASTTKHGLLLKLNNTATDFLNGQGAWSIPTAYAKSASGNYAGNESANRAIAHGFGVTPKAVFITQYVNVGSTFLWWIFTGLNYLYYLTNVGGVGAVYGVTAMNTTNFYVGNATHYSQSANHTGITYYWVAIGQEEL